MDSAEQRDSAATTTREPSADTVKLDLEVPDTVQAGSPVPVTLRITNTGPRAIDLYLRGRTIAFDIFVLNAAGDTVWHRLEYAVLDASLQIRTLQVREELVLADTWNQRTNTGRSVAPGTYSIRAVVLTDQPDGITFPAATLRIAAN